MEEKKKKLLISQELHFAKTLAGNDIVKRTRALKKLYKWLNLRTQDGVNSFSKEDYLRLWKGLFYCMWMSDKPLVQEEDAESISRLIHAVGDGGALFTKCFFLTMIREWNGIDQHRLDKFQMLVRRFLRQAFEWGRRTGWSTTAPSLCSAFEDTILKPSGSQEGIPIGLLLHFSDVYVEELTKAVDEKLQPPESDVVIQLLRPFARLLARNDDARIVNTISETVFHHLMRQSDVGLDYEELRRKGWHRKSKDKHKKGEDNEVDEESEEEEDDAGEEDGEEEGDGEAGDMLAVKDPRAGGVCVVLPQLDVNFADLSTMLQEEVQDPSLRPKLKRRVEELARRLYSITRGNYPLQVGTIPSKLQWKRRELNETVKRATRDLLKLENQLLKKELDIEEEAVPKKKKKMNGELPKVEEVAKGRKWKRGKRKSKAERRAAKRKLLENGIGAEESVKGGKRGGGGRKVIARVVKQKVIKEEVPSKRRSVTKEWEVCKLKSPSSVTRLRHSIGGGDWVVETNSIKGGKASLGKRKKVAGAMVTPKGVLDTKECETELVIRKLRPNPFSPHGRKLMTPQQVKKMELESMHKTPSSNKKVKIVLSRNLSQGTQDYQKSIKASPAIPFDPTKVPSQGVLKETSSPILLNPFYRKNLRSMKITST